MPAVAEARVTLEAKAAMVEKAEAVEPQPVEMEILLDTVIPMAAMPQVTELLVIMHQAETAAQILAAEAVEALTIIGIIRAVKADREL
jgi:hypothetical protein